MSKMPIGLRLAFIMTPIKFRLRYLLTKWKHQATDGTHIVRIAPQWAVGKNYEVRGRDRDTFTYIDKSGRSIFIYWEDGGGNPYNRLIYSSAIKEWNEPKGIPVTREEKEEIKRNSKDGWEFLGVPIVFDE